MAASNTFLKIRIWIKSILFGLVALYVLVFLAKNFSQDISLWLFPTIEVNDVNAMLALFVAFLLGGLITLLVRTIFKTLSQMRQARDQNRNDRLEREISEMKMKSSGMGQRNR